MYWRKKNVYNFFVSPVEINEKKKFSAKTIFGLLPKLYGEKKNYCIATLQLYCKREGWKFFFIAIVLQEKGNCIAIWGRLARNCIAILVLYCNLGGLKGWKIVLQYRELYCNEACK